MTENLAESGGPQDIEEAAVQASEDVVAQREEALAKQLEEQRRKKAKLVDPLQYEMSIQAEDLSGYVPAFGWEAGPPSAEQAAALEKLGILRRPWNRLAKPLFCSTASTSAEMKA